MLLMPSSRISNGWTRGQELRAAEPVQCLNDFDAIQSLLKDLCVLTRTNQHVKAIGEKLYKEGMHYKLITRWQPQMFPNLKKLTEYLNTRPS